MSNTRCLFIVTNDRLILGRGNRHLKIIGHSEIERESVTGGGVFQQNKTHFILFGESFDFGKFDIDLVKQHIENKEVYWFKRKHEEFTFEIDYDRKEKDSDRF